MRWSFGGAVLLLALSPCLFGQNTNKVETGRGLFQQNCAFCHGRAATGGETGPDLTASELVKSDVDGDKIGPVIRNGRPDKGMPRFGLPDDDISALVAFIHNQVKAAANQVGGRRGVTPADLQTGNAHAGEQYFTGAGGCAGCHSATGDFAHIGSKYPNPLRLEMRMLYPQNAKANVTVALPSGQSVTGTVAYIDEFTVAMRDSSGNYKSWRTSDIKFKVDDPAEAHWNQLAKYSDDDIHNLLAYLQTLR